jgi:diguanylate cyclase (GGDEF)-like protein/PAS domain S-box-containing protein
MKFKILRPGDRLRADASRRPLNPGPSLHLYRAVFESTSEAVMLTDAAEHIIAVNPAFTEITGYSESEVIGRTPRTLSSGRHDKSFYQRMWASLIESGRWKGELWDKRKNGQVYPQQVSISAIFDAAGLVTNYVAIFSDISERKSAEERIAHLALHDALTGLPNRALMEDRFDQALAAAQRGGHRVALLLIDLDRFKNVNDSLGHAAGDQLLQGVAKRLVANARKNDTVSRLGGDEFVVILPNISKAEDAAHAAEKILDSLAASFELCDRHIQVTPSIGVSIFPEDGVDFDNLMRNADTAMYRAKESGRNCYRLFARTMNGKPGRNRNIDAAFYNGPTRDACALPLIKPSPQACEAENVIAITTPKNMGIPAVNNIGTRLVCSCVRKAA